MRIVRWTDEPDPVSRWREIEAIFFASSATTTFPSEAVRATFFETWTGYYRASEPERILLAVASDGTLAGYLTGCADSRGAERLFKDIELYAVFEDLFTAFPAHLHVNCRPDQRSRGVGGRLVDAFIEQCRREKLAGVHVVTAVGARNLSFYRRHGFTHEVTRRWGKDRALLFLGRPLTD